MWWCAVFVAQSLVCLSGCGESHPGAGDAGLDSGDSGDAASPDPLYADLRWRVRCQEMGMCAASEDRDINHVDGEDGQAKDFVNEYPAGSGQLWSDTTMTRGPLSQDVWVVRQRQGQRRR